MEEYLDLYTENGWATGKTHSRAEELRSDMWYRIVTIWVRDNAGHLLLTQRQATKRFHPSLWETTGGFAQAGEGPFTAACRELQEETGLTPEPECWHYLGRLISLDEIDGKHYQAHVDSYLVILNEEKPEVTCQPEEVAEARWVTPEELDAMPEEIMEPFTPYSYQQLRRAIWDTVPTKKRKNGKAPK